MTTAKQRLSRPPAAPKNPAPRPVTARQKLAKSKKKAKGFGELDDYV